MQQLPGSPTSSPFALFSSWGSPCQRHGKGYVPLRVMIQILRYLKDPKLRELWYIPYDGLLPNYSRLTESA